MQSSVEFESNDFLIAVNFLIQINNRNLHRMTGEW